MTASSFAVSKQLRCTFTLIPVDVLSAAEVAAFTGGPEPSFINPTFNNGANQLQLTNLRMAATLDSVVGYANQMDLRIYGMAQADMNTLSVVLFGKNPTAVQNLTVMLEANAGNGWTQVFAGTLIDAQPVYAGAPNVYLQVQAQAGYFAGITVGTPSSFPAGTSVANAVALVARAMGFALENNGVSATIPKGSYYPGSPILQLQSICKQAGVDWWFDPSNTIVICPKGQSRTNAKIIALTPQSGLIGYPQLAFNGLTVTALFDPGLILGGKLQLSGTDVPAANGQWQLYAAQHELDAVLPGGSWLSTIQCTPVLT